MKPETAEKIISENLYRMRIVYGGAIQVRVYGNIAQPRRLKLALPKPLEVVFMNDAVIPDDGMTCAYRGLYLQSMVA